VREEQASDHHGCQAGFFGRPHKAKPTVRHSQPLFFLLTVFFFFFFHLFVVVAVYEFVNMPESNIIF
jgi:hypothetical protein